MGPQPLTLIFGGAYDRILDVPAVAADRGLDIRLDLRSSPKDAFSALRDDPRVEAGEMSVSFYLTEYSRSGEAGELVALPVWISRSFRHGNIWVREDSGLTSPAQLRGKRIGLPEYGMTMAVWLRGIFADEYGLEAKDVEWVSHRPPQGLQDDAVPAPQGVTLIEAPEGRTPQQQLLDGEVDAWIGAGQSPPVAGVRRLFADAQAVEREYYRRTGVFPMMHVLVVKRRVLETDPGLAEQLFRVFDEAKRRAQRRLWSTSVAYATLPWTLAAVEEQTQFMCDGMGGGDPWPYGLAANRPTLDTLLRYMGEQGLLWSTRPLTDYFPNLEPLD